MREGAESFMAPAGAAQCRYEALRAYFLDETPAAEVADRFGYSTASVHQMATLLRKGRLALFTATRPGPKGPRKAIGTPRARALEPRAAGHSLTEIAAALTAEGMPVSAQTVWQVLDAEGLLRLARRDDGRRGPPAKLDPVKGVFQPVNRPAAFHSLCPCRSRLRRPRRATAHGASSTARPGRVLDFTKNSSSLNRAPRQRDHGHGRAPRARPSRC